MPARLPGSALFLIVLGLACAGTGDDGPIDSSTFLPRPGLTLEYAYYGADGEVLGQEAWRTERNDHEETVVLVGTREQSRYRITTAAVEIGFHDEGRTEWGLYMPRSIRPGQRWIDDGEVRVEVIEVGKRSVADRGRIRAALLRIDYTPETLGPDRPSTEFEWLAEGLGVVERRVGEDRRLDLRLVGVGDGS